MFLPKFRACHVSNAQSRAGHGRGQPPVLVLAASMRVMFPVGVGPAQPPRAIEPSSSILSPGFTVLSRGWVVLKDDYLAYLVILPFCV